MSAIATLPPRAAICEIKKPRGFRALAEARLPLRKRRERYARRERRAVLLARRRHGRARSLRCLASSMPPIA